jgi:two-component system phosphate regulon sensor histidine kinase PhoR
MTDPRRVFRGAGAGAALGGAALLVAGLADGRPESLLPPGWWVGVVAAALGGAVAAWRRSAAAVRRVAAMRGAVARYDAGDFSGRLTLDETDHTGRAALALDAVVHVLAARVAELEGDRTRLEAALDGMVEGVLALDHQGRITLANLSATRLLHAGDRHVTGRRLTELVRHPEVAEQVGLALTGAAPPGVEFSLGPREQTIVARAAPVPGRLGYGAVLVLHDITDLRRAERVRRDFVANVSHELRTPLTSIRGYVEALLDHEAPVPNPRAFYEVIFRQTQRMERLVQDLLRLARLDARQEVVERTSVDVGRALSAVVADLATSLETRRQRADIQVADDATTVFADAAKLHDILRNLVENASNYSPEDTIITLGASASDRWIELRVADQGPGIPPADLARIFERFYRVDKARSRETGGTGLGLSIVRHLVELHEGEAVAANRTGGGACLTVRLPRNPPPAPRPDSAPARQE